MIKRIHEYGCADCEYSFFHDEENMSGLDCWNHAALPENGAPDYISSDTNTCPYFEWKKELEKVIVEISTDDLNLIISLLEESNNLLEKEGYRANEKNIALLNRLKVKAEIE